MAAWQQPYSVQLDPDSARRLAINGATILLLDVPEATPIGVDQQVFLTGPNFRGIKMMPPGVHFLSFQARSRRDGTLSPPVSTFLHLKPQQVFVRRWDPASEGLVELEEAGRYAAGVARFDFDRELAPYDLNRYSQWSALSCHVSSTVLQQLLPPGGEISIMSEAVDPGLMNPSSAAERRLQQQLEEGRSRMAAAMQVERPDQQQEQQQQQAHAADVTQQQPQPQQQHERLAAARGGRCRYTPLPRVIKLPGAPAAQLTALNVDKTALLEQLIQHYQHAAASSSSGRSGPSLQQHHHQQQQQQQQREQVGGSDSVAAASAAAGELGVVGELQFAFIAFVFGQSLEGYMQWKQLIVLLLGCVTGPLESHTSLFVAFLAVLTAQLQLGFGLGSNGSSSQAGSASAAATAATTASGAVGAEEGVDVGAALLGGGLVEELLPDSFLKQSFRGFFEMVQESGGEVPAPLLTQARVLESVLAAGLGWDFRMTDLLGSDDEFRPVVVELTAEQLEQLEATGQ